MRITSIVLLTLTICLVNNVFSQRDSVPRKFQFGISSNLSVNRYNYGLSNSYVAVILINKHQFELGPKIGLLDRHDHHQNFGIEFNYHYYPNGATKKFNSFIFANTDYFYHSEHYRDNHSGYFLEKSSTTYNFYSFNIGYGFNARIYKGVYFGSKFGCGLLIEDFEYKRTSTSLNEDYGSTHFANDIYNWHVQPKFNFIIEFSLGFRF